MDGYAVLAIAENTISFSSSNNAGNINEVGSYRYTDMMREMGVLLCADEERKQPPQTSRRRWSLTIAVFIWITF